ncbi:MAG: glycosyltransferase [Bacteroidota bacterium]
MRIFKKKKILIVVGSFKIGGAERMSINVGEKLRSNGWEVHYALQRPLIEIPNEIPHNFIHFLNKSTSKHKALVHLNSIIQVFFLRMRLLPGCVMAFTYYSSFIACFTFSRNVIGRFDINPYIINRKLRHRVATFVSKWPWVQRIIVPSHGIGGELRRVNNHFKKKIQVIPNSIDIENVSKMSSDKVNMEIKVRANYIVGMGRLTHQKNYHLLLKAYSQSFIKEKYDLVIIGDGTFKEDLKQLAIDLGIEKQVQFTGFLSNPFPVIKASRFFVNTSNFESFCNVILESLALGVPVIATDCPYGPSEIIVDNKSGLLINTEDEPQLINLLDEIYQNESKIDKLKEGTSSSVEKFKLSHISKMWVKLVQSYLYKS